MSGGVSQPKTLSNTAVVEHCKEGEFAPPFTWWKGPVGLGFVSHVFT